MASGSLSAGTITSTSINVNYSFNVGSNYRVGLFMGSSLLKICGSGSGSGSYTKTGLQPNTNYTFSLRTEQTAP